MPPSLPGSSSVEGRLVALLAFIAAIAVVGVLAIVPYRLYERELVPAADAVYNDALLAFQSNQTPFLVAVRAQESRVLVRLEYLRSLAAYHIALAGVEQALGVPAI